MPSSSKSKLEQGSWLNNQKAPSHCGGCEYIELLLTYWSHLLERFGKGFLLKRMSGWVSPQRPESTDMLVRPFHLSAWPQKDKSEKEACMFLKMEFFSCASVNTPLHGTLHLFCKVYIDPTHREMTPLPSRRACQSARRLFTYNMFHIFIANTTSGVLVSSCIKLMLHFHERLNMKRKARIYYTSTCAGVVGQEGKYTLSFQIYLVLNPSPELYPCRMSCAPRLCRWVDRG